MNLNILFLIFYILKAIYAQENDKCSATDEIIIETKNGKVKGSCLNVNVNTNETDGSNVKGGNLYRFFSIPYAQPPVNELRFKPPQAVKSWSTTVDGTQLPKVCMQFVNKTATDKLDNQSVYGISKNYQDKMSEDCLYLNIYLPAEAYLNRNSDSAKKLPIAIFFHGGAGVIGASILDIYDPSVFAVSNDIIVVSVNYRLGILGFLHLREDNDEIVDGNQGILDQSEAIKWVHTNAEKFGGDKNRITLMGWSAGG